MAKLTSIKPRLNALPSRLQSLETVERSRDQRRNDQQPWRRWYFTARWQRLRQAVWLRDLYTCQRPECGRIGGGKYDLVADHRTPHRGDETLFWDERNLWTLCKPCHDGAKQREERRNA